jgi:hypothetical protein
MNLGPSELVILFLFAAPMLITIWVIIDVVRFSPAAFEASGQSRALWIVLPIVALLACGIGTLVAALVYAAAVRPKLVIADRHDV